VWVASAGCSRYNGCSHIIRPWTSLFAYQ
jgi:hypothetical protein